MVLYHIISSYQLLCAVLHRIVYNSNEKAILILPDFYTHKFPEILEIRNYFFDEAYLFPYMKIPHNKRTIKKDTKKAWDSSVPYNLDEFNKIYLAGTQFYFTDLLIRNKIRFSCFEEAAGICSRWDVLEKNIAYKFPTQMKWAKKRKLIDLKNPLIDEIYCLFDAQKQGWSNPIAKDFDVMECLKNLPHEQRRTLIDFFVKKRYKGKKDAIIILTEQFSNIGKMSAEQQLAIYKNLSDKIPSNLSVYVKPHPDDTTDYNQVFKNATFIKEKFPCELLPFLFEETPQYISTVSSSCVENLKKYFTPLTLV